MMKKAIVICLVIMCGITISAQTKKAYTKAGDKAVASMDYFSAMDYYKNALEFAENSSILQFKYAEAARQFFAYEVAIDYYKKVIGQNEIEKFPLVRFRLGQVYKSIGEYDQAIHQFEQYVAVASNEVFKNKAQREIVDCQWAKTQVASPHHIDITHLDKKINSPYAEFGALRRGDTLYFSSYKYENKKDEAVPPRRISKVLSAVKTTRPRPLNRNFNNDQKLTAHASLTSDGQRIYFTICKYVGATKINCQLYYRDQDTKKRWENPVKLASPINLDGFTNTQPNIGKDLATGKPALYFVSDRPGGKGGLDIYMTLLENDKFSPPVNLDAINTESDDITPFYHASANQLYFSSQGYQGMGGHDIFVAKYNDDHWTIPRHTGYPLNSSYNDIYFTLSTDSTQAYLASNRLGSFYLEKDNKACCSDIYEVKINPPPPTEPVIVGIPPPNIPIEPKPEINIPATPTPPVVPPTIPVTDSLVALVPDPPPTEPITPPSMSDLLPLPLYFHNDEPDPQTRRSTTSRNYEDTYFDYLNLKTEYLDKGGIENKNAINRFFDQEVQSGYEQLMLFVDRLSERLEKGEKLELFIRGFTSPRAVNDYNLALGKRRINSVINFFKSYRQGIFLPYLDKGHLKISEKSFGESTAPAGISDSYQDRKNSVYHPAAAHERRVEIQEITRLID